MSFHVTHMTLALNVKRLDTELIKLKEKRLFNNVMQISIIKHFGKDKESLRCQKSLMCWTSSCYFCPTLWALRLIQDRVAVYSKTLVRSTLSTITRSIMIVILPKQKLLTQGWAGSLWCTQCPVASPSWCATAPPHPWAFLRFWWRATLPPQHQQPLVSDLRSTMS